MRSAPKATKWFETSSRRSYLRALNLVTIARKIKTGSDMNENKRPAWVKPPAHLSKSPPVPEPRAAQPMPESGGRGGHEPTRYGEIGRAAGRERVGQAV